jgi:hypothetical protein
MAVRGRGIVSNAKRHCNAVAVATADIVRFFDFVRAADVRRVFMRAGFDDSDSDLLTLLCCHNFCLPQGAPSSSLLADLVCTGLDARLCEVASDRGWLYTRYVDDMTFSKKTVPLSGEVDGLFEDVAKALAVFGFVAQRAKSRLRVAPRDSLLVSGIVINDGFLRAPRAFCRQLRAAEHQWGRGIWTRRQVNGARAFVEMVEERE